MTINLTYGDVAFPAITGLGLGVGARLARWGYDIANKTGTRAPVKLSPVESAAVGPRGCQRGRSRGAAKAGCEGQTGR